MMHLKPEERMNAVASRLTHGSLVGGPEFQSGLGRYES